MQYMHITVLGVNKNFKALASIHMRKSLPLFLFKQKNNCNLNVLVDLAEG